MRRISTAIVATVATAALALGGTAAQAITWGQPDGDDHPHVVTLLFQQGGAGYFSCSGTLLSPTVVLTAGHCTEGQGQVNSATWVSNASDPLADRVPGVPVAEYLATSGSWVSGQPVPHPQYDDYAAFPDTYDIGLVLLDRPIDTGGVYGTLPTAGFLDSLARARGATTSRQVVVVGYGLQGTVPAFEQGDYLRYRGTSTITGVNRSQYQSTQTVQLSNSPGKGNGSGGTCFGDSGGPAFWVDPATGTETTTVVAVTSYGITGQCAGTDFSFRTDTAVARTFLAGYVTLP